MIEMSLAEVAAVTGGRLHRTTGEERVTAVAGHIPPPLLKQLKPGGRMVLPVGTRFTNDGLEGRIEAHHRTFGRVRGTWGAQLTTNDFVAAGEEAYIPPNDSRATAIFAYEELPGETFDIQFGARLEHQHVRVDAADLPDRDFGGISGSVTNNDATRWDAQLSYRINRNLTVFVDGKNIGDPEVLVGIAKGIGLDAGGAREVIEKRTYKAAVDADWEKSRAYGITGVPTFVAGGYGVVGAQPYEALEQLVAEARKKGP